MKNTIIALFVICLFLLLISCKGKTVFMPIESVKTEWRDKYTRDSIYVKDSVLITKKGDTVFIEKYKYIYRDKLKTDSINKYVGIQIPIPYEVKGDTIYIDKPDSWLDTTQKYIARFGLALLAIFLLVKYRSNMFKFIRKWVFRV